MNFTQCYTHIPKVHLRGPDHGQVRRYNLLYVWHTLDPQALEDERDGLHYHGVEFRQCGIPDNLHQGCYGDRGVEFFQRGRGTHVSQHFTGTLWKYFMLS